MKVKYERFVRRTMLQKWCKDNLEGFDTFGANLWCFKKGEEIFRAASVFGFAQNVNKAYGEMLLPKNCKSVHGRTTLCFLDGEVEKPVETESLISLESEEVKKEEEDTQELVFDLEKCNSFEDKNELEAYGKLFGIDLKKNKSLRNMKADLIKYVNG